MAEVAVFVSIRREGSRWVLHATDYDMTFEKPFDSLDAAIAHARTAQGIDPRAWYERERGVWTFHEHERVPTR